MKRKVIIFLAGGVPAGIFTGFLCSQQNGFGQVLINSLVAGLSFGLLLCSIIEFLHGRAVRKIGDGAFRNETGLDHTRKITLSVPYDRAINLCIESIHTIRNSTVQMEDKSRGIIIARAGFNWKTWSDTISFLVSKNAQGHHIIRVSSRPTARTTLVDFGKNLDNVARIISFLQSHGGDLLTEPN